MQSRPTGAKGSILRGAIKPEFWSQGSMAQYITLPGGASYGTDFYGSATTTETVRRAIYQELAGEVRRQNKYCRQMAPAQLGQRRTDGNEEAAFDGFDQRREVALVGAFLLEKFDEWTVQRGRQMSLETISLFSDIAIV